MATRRHSAQEAIEALDAEFTDRVDLLEIDLDEVKARQFKDTLDYVLYRDRLEDRLGRIEHNLTLRGKRFGFVNDDGD